MRSIFALLLFGLAFPLNALGQTDWPYNLDLSPTWRITAQNSYEDTGFGNFVAATESDQLAISVELWDGEALPDEVEREWADGKHLRRIAHADVIRRHESLSAYWSELGSTTFLIEMRGKSYYAIYASIDDQHYLVLAGGENAVFQNEAQALEEILSGMRLE